MKKIQYIISVSIFIFVLFEINFGQSDQNEQRNKITVVYTDEFSNGKNVIQEFVIASQKVNDKFKVRIEELNKKSEEIKNLAKKVLIANECCENCKVGETEALLNELEKKNCSYNSDQQRLKQEIEKYSNEVLEPIRNKIKESLKSFAESKGYAIILDGSKLKESTILIDWSDLPDITEEFIKFYNEKYKVYPTDL